MQKSTRVTRVAETRDHEMLTQYDMEYKSALDVPDRLKLDGYSYKWVLRSAANQPTHDVETASAQGWTLVPADRDVRTSSRDPLKRDPTASEYVCVKDVILMERPSIFSKRELSALNDKNDFVMRSLQGVSTDYLNDTNSSRLRSF